MKSKKHIGQALALAGLMGISLGAQAYDSDTSVKSTTSAAADKKEVKSTTSVSTPSTTATVTSTSNMPTAEPSALPSDSNITVRLVDEPSKAAKKAATVEVTVPSNLKIMDPDMAGERTAAGQAHLHYQLDNGPITATTATKLSFHNLTPGTHRIAVTLANNDHTPIGSKQEVTVNIP